MSGVDFAGHEVLNGLQRLVGFVGAAFHPKVGVSRRIIGLSSTVPISVLGAGIPLQIPGHDAALFSGLQSPSGGTVEKIRVLYVGEHVRPAISFG